jgi:hypothetical protein
VAHRTEAAFTCEHSDVSRDDMEIAMNERGTGC